MNTPFILVHKIHPNRDLLSIRVLRGSSNLLKSEQYLNKYIRLI